MAAKDVLDLQLSVRDLAAAAVAFDGPLARLGYVRRPYEHDHVPAGADSDPACGPSGTGTAGTTRPETSTCTCA